MEPTGGGRVRRRTGWRRALVAAGSVYLATLAVNRSLVEVTGPSMEPSLWDGDRLLTLPAHRWWLRRGQVVVVRDPGRPGHLAVKRLASLGPDGVVVLGDAGDRSTDGRSWGALPIGSVRRIAIARWPDIRTPLTRIDRATPQPRTDRPADPPSEPAASEVVGGRVPLRRRPARGL